MTQQTEAIKEELSRSLGLFSATAIVAGSMVGSGIFIVTADASRYLGSGGLLIALWVFTGVLTLLGAMSYGKLASYLPEAGGQYVFLKKSWGEIPAFLFGWALFLVIQTGFLAAVSVAFAKYVGVLVPAISSEPLFMGASFQQLLAVATLVGLTIYNSFGVKQGAMLQNVFTSLKVIALLLLIAIGLSVSGQIQAGSVDWSLSLTPSDPSIFETSGFLAIFAFASVGPLFSSDAWNYVTFIGGEVKDAKMVLPKALTYGTGLVVVLYLLVNIGYLNLLPMEAIQHANEDRVATDAISVVFGDSGALIMAAIILISTFGCLNGLLLAGARVFYAMAKDGLLFRQFGEVNPKTRTPNFSMWAQCIWGSMLTLSGSYGQLLDYIIFTALLFYMVTMAGLIKLGREIPDEVNMKTPLDYAIPILYILGASFVGFFMLVGEGKFMTSIIGLGLTLSGLPVYFVWKKLKTSN